MSSSGRREVAVFSRELSSYRVAFFETVRKLLDHDNIDLRLLVGGATQADRSKKDNAQLGWAEHHPARELRLRHREFWWQPVAPILRTADLIITEQASKQLANLPLSVLQRLGRTRHCLWGHGRNFQATLEGGSGERLKQWFTEPAHWFFSYTDASTEALLEMGFPSDRITTVNNSTDVTSVRTTLADLPDDNETLIRNELGLGAGPVVGYLGGLYPPKRIGFLLESLDALRRHIPDLQVIVIGSGTEANMVQENAASRDWLHPMGPLYGPERVRLAAVCSALLMPGLVGLNVVDGFALGLPTITTAIDYHSPEISYLQHGVNGWVSPEDASAASYAADVAGLLADSELLARLQHGANTAADGLGIEAMAEHFAAGVRSALEAPSR